ncbi:MAG: hypothetical protein HUJ55_07040 [Ileibacterium sp.]|nr:hypothetical protein [Ileibacterium sp.]
MKVVFFGDSNTWGFDPDNGSRQSCRFVKQLEKMHPDWEIVEEGLNGRTLNLPDPYALPRNGAEQISSVIRSHLPYDVLVVMLGTNDAKSCFQPSPRLLERGLKRFLNEACNPALDRTSPYKMGRLLLVQPPQLNQKAIEKDPFSLYGQNGIELMANSGPIFENAARTFGVDVLRTDGDDPVVGGECDGIHLEEEGHAKLARKLNEKLCQMEKELNQ